MLVIGAIAAVFAGLARDWAAREEQRFRADARRVDAARTAITARTWTRPLLRIGAAAGLAGVGAMLAAGLLLLALLLAGITSAPVGGPVGWGLLAAIGLLLVAGLISLPAVLLCRCHACAGAVFDNGQAPRRGFAGIIRENILILSGRGRCPRCGALLSASS